MIVLLALVAVLGALAVHDAVRVPLLRRLALRNVMRRRGEAALVIAGCVLGAAIVTSSLLVGDSLRASVRDVARTDLGPVDEMVRVPSQQLDAARAAVAGELPPGADVLAARRSPAVLVAGDGGRAEPRAQALEIDFDAARAFGGDPGITGLEDAGPTPAPGRVVLDGRAADELDAGPGDRIGLVAAGGRTELVVDAVVPREGIAGLTDRSDEPGGNAFVAPGTLDRLAPTGGPAARGAEAVLLIGNGGGVFGGVDRTDEVSAATARALGIEPGAVQPVKRELVEVADEAGASFTAIFAAIGAVAVIAGVLLLVNVFVMLAEERKAQLGTLRALGLKRLGMVRAFGVEGAVYSIVGGTLGALAGIGVARVIVAVADRIFAAAGEEMGIRLAVPAESVLVGLAIGAGISLATVWATSARIARLNVIRAIRDQPSPPWRRSLRRIRAGGAVALAIGVAVTWAGLAGDSWPAALVGPVLLVAGLAAATAGRVPGRVSLVTAGVLAFAWSTLCIAILPETFEEAGVSAFVAQGVAMCAAAILLATLWSGGWMRLARRARRGALPLRLGLAYPIARPFRTGIQMGMFALVVFGLVFMSILSSLWTEQGPRYVRDIGAGYEVIADSSPGNPVAAGTLEAQPGVATVAPLVRALPQFSAPRHPEFAQWYLTGFDGRLLARGTPALSERDPGYADDRAALAAVMRSSDLAIVPDWFLQTGAGTPASVVEVGESIVVRDPGTGRERRMRVVGVVGADWALAGVMVGAATARALLGDDAVESRAMVAVEPGADPGAVADALTATLVQNGVDAESVQEVVDRGLSTSRSFMALSQGYVALGLVIGIGGLAVVMIRAVRERRRQIGMLRAMGVPSGTVREAFTLESAFVAARGLVIGGVLAVLSCWLLVTRSDALGEDRLAFTAPWATLVALLVASLVAAVVATALPAARAARIRPAVALRVAD